MIIQQFAINIFMFKYTVYKTTNIINEKYYIGVHRTKNIYDNYLGSGRVITDAIKKYGRKNFSKEILYVFDNKDDMYQKEADLVTSLTLEDDQCYNLLQGGRNTFREREYDLSAAVRGRHKEYYIYVNNGIITRCIKPEEEILFIKDGWIRGNLTLSRSVTGTKHTPEHNNAVRQKLTGSFIIHKDNKHKRCYNREELECYLQDGWCRGFLKGRRVGNHKGSKNSSYGKKLINNPLTGQHKRITPEAVEFYLQEGWLLGWLDSTELRQRFHT